MENERLKIVAQMAAALVPHMLQHTPWDIARRAAELADALIEVCDEPAKPE
jgi:hypothetical protein